MSSRVQPRIKTLTEPAQLRALTSPTRMRVFQAVQEIGPCGAAQIADRVGMKPASVYYHVHALAQAGLIEVAQGEEGQRTVLYRSVAKSVKVAPKAGDTEYLEALADLASAGLREADRSQRRALHDPEITLSGAEQERLFLQVTSRLTRKHLRELNRRLIQLMLDAEDSDTPTTDRRYTIVIAMSPTE
ncbi:MAG: helix-turn-helix domain-containing protein [Planctomycetota bacterium]